MARAVTLALADLEGERGSFRLKVPRLTLEQGQTLLITGPSGCGKSSLLDIVGLVLRPRAAQVFTLCGQEVTPLWRAGAAGRKALAALRARTIGYVLQTGGLLPFLTVAENICLSPSLLGQAFPADWRDHLLDQLGLRDSLAKVPRNLSIGERQRVAIARALAHRPALVLADEPTAALDPHNAERVLSLLFTLARVSGAAMLLVSHDTGRVASLGLPVLQVETDRGMARFVAGEG